MHANKINLAELVRRAFEKARTYTVIQVDDTKVFVSRKRGDGVSLCIGATKNGATIESSFDDGVVAFAVRMRDGADRLVDWDNAVGRIGVEVVGGLQPPIDAVGPYLSALAIDVETAVEIVLDCMAEIAASRGVDLDIDTSAEGRRHDITHVQHVRDEASITAIAAASVAATGSQHANHDRAAV